MKELCDEFYLRCQNIKPDINPACNYHFNFPVFTPPAARGTLCCHVTLARVCGTFPAW